MSPIEIQRGKTATPLRVLTYGVPGVGKTTLAGQAPDPVFLPVEDGCGALDVARLPQPESWAQIRASVRWLIEQPHDFRTLVIDTLDQAERLCWEEVVRAANKAAIKSIEDFGYGKGYVAALDLWRQLAADLELLQRKRGMGIVLIAHSVRRTFRNPEGDDYDRWTLALQERAAGFLVGWCHDVLFARWEVLVASGDSRVAKGVSTGKRELRTMEDGPWTAKNRHGLPSSLPLLEPPSGWAPLAAALCPDPGQVRARIQCALSGADEGLRKQAEGFLARAGADVGLLHKTEQWLAGKLAGRSA